MNLHTEITVGKGKKTFGANSYRTLSIIDFNGRWLDNKDKSAAFEVRTWFHLIFVAH